MGQYLAAVQFSASVFIYVSSNFGSTWSPIYVAGSDWKAVAVSSTGQYMAAAAGGPNGVYMSSNHGASWSRTTAPTAYWWPIVISGTGQYLVVGANYGGGGMYISSNYGSSWTQASLSTSISWSLAIQVNILQHLQVPT